MGKPTKDKDGNTVTTIQIAKNMDSVYVHDKNGKLIKHALMAHKN